jgi:hypothetical protein
MKASRPPTACVLVAGSRPCHAAPLGAFDGAFRSGRETIETVSLWQGALAHVDRLEQHVLGEVLIFANIIQVPAVILTGAIAWLVCRPIQRWLIGWVDRLPEGHHLDWIASHRTWVTHRVGHHQLGPSLAG